MFPSSDFSLCLEGEKREGYGHPVLRMCKIDKKEGKWEQMNSELKEGVMETGRLDAVVQDTSPEKKAQIPGLPGRILAKVKRVESLATKQEEKSRAESFWCSSASSCSSST